ncbi:MAG TPA: nucleoside deaminase [Patescibacteria group bacterium]|nr:nucleoside deaminase [Patescibacteria group bacterium]
MMDADFLRVAIAKAREGIAAGQSPFGSVVVRGAEVVVATHNTVWRDTDPTAHAEVNSIRAASRALGTIDLSACVLYSTCEPCPMCLSAIHWAKFRRVVYGAEIADAAAAGFSELRMPARELARAGGSKLVVEGGLLAEECRALFDEFRRASAAKAY